MTYRLPLPEGSRRPWLDLIEPNTTEIQRFIRRLGLAAYEPPTAAAVCALCDLAGDGFVMYDVGSNVGLYAHLAASLFQPSRIVAFEPAPKTASMSRSIVDRNALNVDVVEAAVGAQPGRASLYFSPTSDASNSLVEGFRRSTGSTEVDVVTIDDHVERTGLVPDVIKIDVETYEAEVLRGARGTVTNHRPKLIIEVLKREEQHLGRAITAELDGLGYHYYPLPDRPDWNSEPSLYGLGTTDRDWLVLPEPVGEEVVGRWEYWRARLSTITVDRNPRVPWVLSARAAFGRGGVREVGASARRYASSVMRRDVP